MTNVTAESEFPYVYENKATSGPGAIHQVVDQSVNKALPWVAIACILGALAVGASISTAIMVPQMIDQRTTAIKEVVDARLAALPEIIDARATEKAARAIALAEIAEREARIAQDDVGLMRIEQAKLGIVTPNDH